MWSKVKERLSCNVLENITLLKMIDTYGSKLGCTVLERDSGWGLLLSLPVEFSSYDRKTYPEAESVYMLAGTDNRLLERLLDDPPIPKKPTVFKVQRSEYKQLLERKFKLAGIRSFYSYSCLEPFPGQSPDEVTTRDTLQEELLPMWLSNGYELGEIEQLFAHGARSYSFYTDGKPASTCIVFRNYGRVWEVGAVHTAEEYRGNGYAKKVVQAAVNGLLSRNLIPRYQVEDRNRPSVLLAESLGLTRLVTLEHLYWNGG